LSQKWLTVDDDSKVTWRLGDVVTTPPELLTAAK